MSLVAATLFRHPPPKFTGRIHTFSSEKAVGAISSSCNARNEETKQAGIERVFNAIDGGKCRTVMDIVNYTGLCKSTVQKALGSLEHWDKNPRIIRNTSGIRHTFSVKGKS